MISLGKSFPWSVSPLKRLSFFQKCGVYTIYDVGRLKIEASNVIIMHNAQYLRHSCDCETGFPPMFLRNLRYTDFISSQTVCAPLIRSLEDQLSVKVDFVAPSDETKSGPRFDEAVSTFVEGLVDLGRI